MSRTRTTTFLAAGTVLGLLIAALAVLAGQKSARPDDPFAATVDLGPLDRAAVHSEGRFKSFDSFANEMVGYISGPRKIDGLPRDMQYLDMLFRPERYTHRDVIYFKNKPMRARLKEVLEDRLAELAEDERFFEAGVPESAEERKEILRERLEAFEKTGLIAEAFLMDEAAQAQLALWQRDIIRTSKFANAVRSAMVLKSPEVLSGQLRIVPAPKGDETAGWLSMDDLYAGSAMSSDADAMDPVLRAELRGAWEKLAAAWREGDAEAASAAVAELAERLPRVNPAVYPSQTRLQWESVYFKHSNLTWIWVIYLASVTLLLMAVAYRWEGARWLGIGAFGVAFALHTIALGLRWYVSGRWPNSNMFEAVTTSVWLGTSLAIVIEVLARRTPMRNLFMLGGAVASMAAMMSARYIPQLDPNIRNMMPVLSDLWLYIHTNVIITSYALIAMAAVTALLYLGVRAFGGPPDYARAGGTGMLLESGTGSDAPNRGMMRGGTAAQVLDGATMVLMELSFVLLWAGIVMGAIWADHSWGRPWGWDPKEVFALNTFLVFLVLVHVRLKARDKGLWTAVLAVIGCGVMLFNWIVINFVISGLHSYA